jgi:UDP-N-acetylmuramyl tripeptide synthase
MKQLTFVLLQVFFSLLNIVLRLTGRGAGTALPGLICEQYFPWVYPYLIGKLKNTIAITGTNGKTTTQSILKDILEAKGYTVLNNKAGSNMKRGIISELLKRASLSGELNFDYTIFEVEEATFPKIITDINPQIIIITNLFRDQLDAYGEIDKTQSYIVEGIKLMPKAKIILNFDDPKVREIKDMVTNQAYFVHLEDEITKEIQFEIYDENTDKTQTQAENIVIGKDCKTDDNFKNAFNVILRERNSKILLNGLTLDVPGKFQIYNALSAIAAARLLSVDVNSIRKGIEVFKPAFGRGEEIGNFRILLVKNPAGGTLNIDLIKDIKKLNLMLILNDNTADGKDVSWIWDCDFEKLNQTDIEYIIFSGKRAYDMQLRIKYALSDRKFKNLKMDLETNISNAVQLAKKNGNNFFVLPTYTGMLELRKALGKKLD